MSTERRRHPRFKVSVPVEIYAEGSDTPIHFATSDLSLDGCYIESMYPFPIGTSLDLKLQLSDTVLIAAKAVTSDPQFGNGLEFLRMLPEDHEALAAFLAAQPQPESAESK